MSLMITFRYKPASEEQLMKAFQTLDTEGQGFLTQEQLSKLMMEEGPYCSQLVIVVILVIIIVIVLRSVSTTRVHGPSSRAELTARELGCIF